MLAREPHRGDHIGDAPAPRDQRRATVDVAVPDLADVVVRGIGRFDEIADEIGPQRLDGGTQGGGRGHAPTMTQDGLRRPVPEFCEALRNQGGELPAECL